MTIKKEENNSVVYIENVIGKLKVDSTYLVEKETNEYEGERLVRSIIESPIGNKLVTDYEFDDNGNPITATTYVPQTKIGAKGKNTIAVSHTEYDSLGRVVKIYSDNAANFTTKSYDKSGVTVVENSGNGAIIKTKYDNDGNVTYQIETYNDNVLYKFNRRKSKDKLYLTDTRYKEDGSVDSVEKRVFLDTKTDKGYVLVNTSVEDEYSMIDKDTTYNDKWQEICCKTRSKNFNPDNRKEYTVKNSKTLYDYDEKGRLISYISDDNSQNCIVKYYDKYTESVTYAGDRPVQILYSFNPHKSKSIFGEGFMSIYLNESGDIFKDYRIIEHKGEIREATFADKNKVYRYVNYTNMRNETVRQLEVTVYDKKKKLAIDRYKISSADRVGEDIYNEVFNICNKIISKEFVAIYGEAKRI